MAIDIAFADVGQRWSVWTENPLVRDYLQANPPARAFWLDGGLWIYPHQVDELMAELRTVGLIEDRADFVDLFPGL